jgi:hypothetical protein
MNSAGVRAESAEDLKNRNARRNLVMSAYVTSNQQQLRRQSLEKLEINGSVKYRLDVGL